MRDYVRWGYDWSCVDTCVDTNIIELEAPVNVRFEVNAEYPHYYTNLRNWHNDHSYDVSNDTLRLFWGRSVPYTGFPVGICWNASWKGVDSIRPKRASLRRSSCCGCWITAMTVAGFCSKILSWNVRILPL